MTETQPISTNPIQPLVNAGVPPGKKVSWDLPGTWAWMALIIFIGGSGVLMRRHSFQRNK